MRIAYILNSIIPSTTANSVHVMKMCQALTEEGHDVNLIIPERNGAPGETEDDVFRDYGVNAQFKITRLKISKVWRTWDFALAAVLAAKRGETEMVFSRLLPAAFLSTTAGIPTIFEIHDVPRGLTGSRLFPYLLGRGYLRRLVVLTEALRSRVEEVWPEAMQRVDVLVAHDAVDLQGFYNLPSPSQARQKVGMDERFTAGYVGSLYHGRGIEAILAMAKECPEVYFHIVGGPEEMASSFARHLKMHGIGNVGFKGYVPHTNVPDHLAACEVLLMPYERIVGVSGLGGNTADVCSPLKMFEYLAAGRMVIASDLPVFREVVDDKCMLLLPPEDVSTWTKAIRKAQNDVSWRKKYADAGMALVQNYSWRARARNCLADIRG